jgi:hypothetical protein
MKKLFFPGLPVMPIFFIMLFSSTPFILHGLEVARISPAIGFAVQLFGFYITLVGGVVFRYITDKELYFGIPFDRKYMKRSLFYMISGAAMVGLPSMSSLNAWEFWK